MAGGKRAAPAGNYGPPAAQVVRERPDLEWLVLEVSSFQLETTRDFRPDIGVVLNVFPNHLDRHGSRAAYLALKARLFARARFGDTCLVNAGLLQELKPLVGTGRGVWRTFDCAPPADYVYRAGAVEHDGRVRARFDGTYFGNDVLGLTAAAVVAALDAAGLPPAAAETVARRFEPLPHRMQVVAVRDGVTFINDSKATNLTAMAAALRMTGGGVRLIAGGLAKESDFEFVRPVLAEKARGVYLIGQAAVAMAAAWADTVACQVCGTLEAAVAQAWRDAAPGECVLLAPACASFDQFRNYEERGNCFMKYVENLSGRTA